MELNYKFSKHLSTRMRSSRTGLKAQRGQEKRRSPEEDEGTLCGWKVDEEHGLWDDIGIEDCLKEASSEESVNMAPGRRCPLLIALETELQDQERNTHGTGATNDLSDLPQRPSGKSAPKPVNPLSSSITRTEKGRDKETMEGEWRARSKQPAKILHEKSTNHEFQLTKTALIKASNVMENKKCYDKSVFKWKQESTRRKSSCKKNESYFPPHSSVAAIIYPDKPLESNLRERLKKRTDTKTCITSPKEKKLVNPSLIGCSAEPNEPLELASACAESRRGREGEILRDASHLKLPLIGASLEGPICTDRSSRTKSGTTCNSQQLPCKCEDGKPIASKGCKSSDHKDEDLSTKSGTTYEDKREESRKSTPQRTGVNKSSFQFDVLEQYSVIRKTSTESLSKSSPVEQMPCRHESGDVATSTEKLTQKQLRIPGCSNTVKLPLLSRADCTCDTRSFDAVRALWCVLQRERLVVHVTQNARSLSKGSRSLASELMLRNRTPSAKREESIYEEAFPQGFRASKSQCPLQRIRDVTNKRLELQEDSGRVFHESVGRKMKCRKSGASTS